MRLLLSAMIFGVLAFAASGAQACGGNTPAGVEGEIIFNETTNAPQFCDGDNWVAMVGGAPEIGSGVVTDGLIGYWPLDGNADDAIGSNDGTLIGNATFTALQVNDGITLDGTGDRINLGSDSSIDNITGPMSICLWASKDSGGGYQTLIGKSTDGYNGWDFYWAGGNGFGFLTPRNGYRERTAGVTQSTFHHLCGTWDGTNGSAGIILYLDGSVYTGTSGNDLGADLNDVANDMFIGGGSGTDFPGDIDDVRLYNRVISPAEITEIYNCGVAGDCGTIAVVSTVTEIIPDDLIAHWRLDEDTGTTASDSSGNGYDGTIQVINATSNNVVGVIDNALEFNANGNGIDVPPINVTGPELTISAWVYLNSITEDGRIVSKTSGTSGSSHDWALYIEDEEEAYPVFAARVTTSSGYNEVNLTDYEVPLQEWVHVGVTYNSANTSSELSLYINGQFIADYNINGGNIVTSAKEIGIGNNPSSVGNRYIDGILDDVRIYDRALNNSEFRSLHQATDGIRYNSNNRTMEYFDGNRFVSMTPSWPEVDEGPIYGDYADLGCPNIGDPCSDGSVYAGITPDGNVPMYTTAANAPGGAAYSWNNGNNTGKVQTFITNDTTGEANTAALVAIDSDNITDGNQPHQAAQYCYDLDIHENDDWYLPAREEFRLFDGNMTAIGGFTPGGSYYYADSTEGGSGFIYDWHQWGANNAGITGGTVSETSFHVRCVRKAKRAIAGTGGLVGHWKLDETEGTTAVDSTGNNNATFSGVYFLGMPGAIGKSAALFEDGDIYTASTATNISNMNKASFSKWFKIDIDSNSQQFLIDKNGDYSLSVLTSTNNFAFTWDRWANIPEWRTVDNSISTYDRWHHLVVTYDSSSISNAPRFYLNGTLINSSTITAPLAPINTAAPTRLNIGNQNNQLIPLLGKLDDLRIYDRVLTPAEVQMLFNMGGAYGQNLVAPEDCPNIGDVCDDGTVYAGESADGSVDIYAAPNDEPGDYTFGSLGDARLTGGTDGDGNTLRLASYGQSAHPAAYQCFTKSFGGATDWYLPSQTELIDIAGSGTPLAPNFNLEDERYWSSTEVNANSARTVTISTATPNNTNKDVHALLRCVRKGPAPRCSNPYGLAGEMVYNNTSGGDTTDVVQYCDGARWIAIGKSAP